MNIKQLRIFLPYLRVYRREILAGLAALLLTDFCGLAIPWLLKTVVDLLPQQPSSAALLFYVFLLLTAAGLQGLFRFGWRKYIFGPSRRIEGDILNRLFTHLLRLDKTFYQGWQTGDLMSRATNDIRAARDFMGLGVLVIVDCSVVLASSLGLLLYLNPRLTVYALLPLPLVSIIFYRLSITLGHGHRAVQERLAKISSLVQENLAGIKILHAYVQEEHEQQKFAELNRQYLQENMRLARRTGLFNPSFGLVVGIAALIALWFGGKAVIAGEMTLGAFVAFNGYLMMLSWPMMGIGYVVNLTQKGIAAMTRINEILDAAPAITDTGGFREEIGGGIEFRNVSFQYPGGSAFALRAVSFTLAPGGSLALAGKIGAGKSTAAQLILRLFDCQSGLILIDGRPIQEFALASLRAQIGYVEQNPFLFSATIRGNIALGRTGETSLKEVEEAAFLAGLEPDLIQLPKGLETEVGEKGVILSGGQKQRVALARALIRRPKILILDDAFAALDIETETRVLQGINEHTRGVTKIIISHRQSAIRDTGQIVLLENGAIVAAGAHADLQRQGHPYYRELCDKNRRLAGGMEIILT